MDLKNNFLFDETFRLMYIPVNETFYLTEPNYSGTGNAKVELSMDDETKNDLVYRACDIKSEIDSFYKSFPQDYANAVMNIERESLKFDFEIVFTNGTEKITYNGIDLTKEESLTIENMMKNIFKEKGLDFDKEIHNIRLGAERNEKIREIVPEKKKNQKNRDDFER